MVMVLWVNRQDAKSARKSEKGRGAGATARRVAASACRRVADLAARAERTAPQSSTNRPPPAHEATDALFKGDFGLVAELLPRLAAVGIRDADVARLVGLPVQDRLLAQHPLDRLDHLR